VAGTELGMKKNQLENGIHEEKAADLQKISEIISRTSVHRNEK